tara:strand:- start:110 stop:256 length:147 start_codon:yes stop_codon:yes gene_type:complete
MKKSKTTKILECRYKNCTNTETVADTSKSVICAPCTFKISEGLLEYSK